MKNSLGVRIMGNTCAKTTVAVDDVKVGVGVTGASASFGHCASSCCGDVEEKQETDDTRKMREIQMACRYGKNMSAPQLLAAIEKIVGETGEVPDVVVIPPGGATPTMLKRTLSIRIDDHSPSLSVERKVEI